MPSEENVQFDSAMDSFPEPVNSATMHNYQVTYENLDGEDKTEIIPATHVITEGDLYEFWYGNVLVIAIMSENVLLVRNVSLMMEA